MARRNKLAKSARNPFDPLDGAADHQLDLHTFDAARARAALRTYVSQTRKRSPGALLHVITGKGHHSLGAPVLKPLVQALLKGELSSHVHAWGLDDAEGGYLVRLKH